MLQTAHADGVTTITFDDGKANAMSLAMLKAINAGLDEAEEAGEVVLLVGKPGTFSAGYDLKTFMAGIEPLHAMLQAGGNLVHRLLGFPTPVVAACTGHAPAMGAFLLLACDRRIGADGPGRIGANEVRINMAVPHWTIELFRDRVNPAHASRTLLTGELFDVDTAMAAGFLDEVVPADQVLARATEVAIECTGISLDAHRATKSLLRADLLERVRGAIDTEITIENITAMVAAAAG